MQNRRPPGRDAANLKRGHRVSRKDDSEFGTVTNADPASVKVKWDKGSTSYFRRDEAANVRRSTEPVQSLVVCPGCEREMRLLGVEHESHMRDLFTLECEGCNRFEILGVRVT